MIQLDLSILNQKGTPMFNSDIFANRPPFGIVGRIFISTDTSQIFRDTGTSYVLISDTSGGGSVSSVGLSSATSGVTIGSSPITTSGTITLAIATASGSQNGLLSSADFTNFNNKQSTISLTTNGTSGASTFSANTLNIPQYQGVLTNPITGTGTPGALSLFLTSSTLGDSLITQSASVLTAAAKTLISNTFTGISLLNPLGLSVGTNNTFNGGITWPSLEPCDNVEFLQNNNYNGNITYGNGSYTANHLILSSFQFIVASITLTSNQTTGIRALSNQILQARINGTNNGTITHFANSLVYGDFAASTARFNFTNRYGYLVNNLDEYAAGHTYTNRYAFYNQGANDHNHFAGKMLLNTLVVTSDQLSVVGTTNLNGALKVTGGSSARILTLNAPTDGGSLVFETGGIAFADMGSNKSILGSGSATDFYLGTRGVNNLILGTGFNDHLFLDSLGNLGLSLQPKIWNNIFCVFQIGFTGCLFSVLNTTEEINLSSNYFQNNTGNDLRIQSGFASKYQQKNGNHLFFSAGTSTANSVITFTQVMTLNASGNLSLGNINDTFKLDVSGTGRFTSPLYVGVSTIDASAQLEADSTTKGFLPPRMTTTQINAIATPAEGLIAYNTTLSHLCVYQAGAWAKLSHSPM